MKIRKSLMMIKIWENGNKNLIFLFWYQKIPYVRDFLYFDWLLSTEGHVFKFSIDFKFFDHLVIRRELVKFFGLRCKRVFKF